MSAEAEIARLTRRVRDEPRSLAFVALADALRRAGRPGEGMQVLREGFRIHPEHPAGKVVLARIHLDLGKREPAVDVLREVVAADAENLAAASLLSRLLIQDNRGAEAAPLIARLRMANHPDALLPELAGARVEVPAEPAAGEPVPLGSDPFDHPSIADRLTARGDLRGARALWSRIAEENPESAVVRERIARLDRIAAGIDPGFPEGLGRPLPGRLDLEVALVEEERQRPPPRGRGAAGRWARSFWGDT